MDTTSSSETSWTKGNKKKILAFFALKKNSNNHKSSYYAKQDRTWVVSLYGCVATASRSCKLPASLVPYFSAHFHIPRVMDLTLRMDSLSLSPSSHFIKGCSMAMPMWLVEIGTRDHRSCPSMSLSRLSFLFLVFWFFAVRIVLL